MAASPLVYGLLSVLLLAAGFGVGWFLTARIGRRSLAKARAEAMAILADARGRSEQIRKLEIARARETWMTERAEKEAEYLKRLEAVKNVERAMNRRDAQLQQVDTQLQQREAEIDEARGGLEARASELDAEREGLTALHQEFVARLEKAAGMSVEEAKRHLVASLKNEAEHEAALMIRAIKEEAKRTADQEAAKIVTLAIERVAVDQVVPRTTSQYRLPDESMKGRLIGHEGRNIKFFEEQTGMQLLLNSDDPTLVTISGFNPVAREVARQSLDRLVQSGKIHPRKIQEVVGKVQKKIQRECQAAGEEAFKYLGLALPNAEIVKLIGKLKYRTSYGQNVLNHSIEVAELCGSMAAELDLDANLAKRAGLLHDLGKAIDVEREGTHPELGGEAARAAGENEVVVNAIESHHEDVEVIHPISILVAVCDGISGSRPGARRASLADYLKRIETLEGLANSFDGVEQSFAIQAGREIRVIVKTDRVDDERLSFLASDISKKIEEEMDFPGRVKVTLIREMKAVEYAGAV